jgi:hypothetical protein
MSRRKPLRKKGWTEGKACLLRKLRGRQISVYTVAQAKARRERVNRYIIFLHDIYIDISCFL